MQLRGDNNQKRTNPSTMNQQPSLLPSGISDNITPPAQHGSPKSPMSPAANGATATAGGDSNNGNDNDVFYPATRFTGWIEFFTITNKQSTAAGKPSSSTSSAAAGVTPLHKLEMFFYISVCVLICGNFIGRLYHVSRNLDKIVGQGNFWLDLEPPRFLSSWLSPGIDVSDHQLRRFEQNIGLLLVAFAVYIGIAQLARRIVGTSNTNKHAVFLSYAVMSVGFVVFVHGWGCIPLLMILSGHYGFTVYFGRRLPRWLFLTVKWVVLTVILVGAEWHHGFRDFFREWMPATLMSLFRPPMMDWHGSYNMQMLRLIAFSVDYNEAADEQAKNNNNGNTNNNNGAEEEKKQQQQLLRGSRAADVAHKHRTQCNVCAQIAAKHNSAGLIIAEEIQPVCYKARTETPRGIDEYNFTAYLAYVLYLPLYVGGPISSFNAFVSHVHTPQRVMKVTDMVRYAVRVAALYFCLVLLNHLCYLNSIRKQPAVLKQLPVLDQTGVMYLMLAFLWLKFSVIWKFFRLVGLVDGIESPEDMNRCFSNTVRVAEFWRDWHSSFNLWIVRYMYVPLGGNKNKVLVVFPIFLFIALWHDTAMELLSWALIMCVNFALELILTAYCSKVQFWRRLPIYRHLVTLGGVWTVFSLIIANAFGFGTGMTSSHVISNTVKVEITEAVLLWFVFVFSSTSVSMIDREIEKNRNKRIADELKLALSVAGGGVAAAVRSASE